MVIRRAHPTGTRGSTPNVYRASKAAVISFTKSLAIEYAPMIRANCVCPGIVNTDMMDREYAWENEMTGEPISSIKGPLDVGIPMGRFQEPHDVANLVAFCRPTMPAR